MSVSALAFAPEHAEGFTAAAQQLHVARSAQKSWAQQSLKQRLLMLRKCRHLLASEALEIASLVSSHLTRAKADTLSAEVLPLAEAIRFLELEAPGLLKPTRIANRARPLWLPGLQLQVQRDPWGVVLVIGPSNYPLLLPGVQTVQALAAGNAVFWKPGTGGAPVARAMADLLIRAGLPDGLLTVTSESKSAAEELLQTGVDKVVLTGSESSGRAVLKLAAERLTPVTAELSGCDAMFVLDSADLSRSVDALLFGLRLNGSGTCIAPRRIFLSPQIEKSFKRQLLAKLPSVPPVPVNARTSALVSELVRDAIDLGATLLVSSSVAADTMAPVVLDGAKPEMRVMRTDVFAPIVSLCTFKSQDEALALAEDCPYALGATVFGATPAATSFAKRVKAGLVVVNDMIAPTADPRISFGGRGRSGFGKTRGAEGLLEMTVSKTVAVQTAKRLRHLEAPHRHALHIFSGFLKSVHGAGLGFRVRGLWALGKTLAGKSESQNS